MVDSQFWEKMEKEFRDLPNDPYGTLRANWSENIPNRRGSGRKSRTQKQGFWWLTPGSGIDRFEALARTAGAALDPVPSDSRDVWLDNLREHSLKEPSGRFRLIKLEVREHGKRMAIPSGYFNRVCDVSANFCAKLRADAFKQERSRNFLAGSRVHSKRLTNREAVMVRAIRDDLTGLRYCRYLDQVQIKPKNTWISNGCARTYEAAYKAGKPWKKYIQDEKSRARAKARLTAKNL